MFFDPLPDLLLLKISVFFRISFVCFCFRKGFRLNAEPIRFKFRDFALHFKALSVSGKKIFCFSHHHKDICVRDNKPPNHESCFPQFFSRIFLSFSSERRNQSFHWSKTKKSVKNLFSFSTAQAEKVSWKKNGENKIRGLVV